jgi:GNAT superfamily N-acetyltransferase
MPAGQVGIRPLRRAHRDSAAALFAETHPERAYETARWDEPGESTMWLRRAVAVAGTPERVVGYGALWQVWRHKFRIDLAVAAEHRRCGIGGLLLDWLVDQAHTAGAATVQARADSDWVPSLAFLHHRGFSETMRMHRLVLDVAAATLAPFADVERRLAAQGITLTNLADEHRRIGDACWVLLCDLHNDAREGWPNPDPDPGPAQPSTIEEVRRLHDRGDRDWPVPCFLAVRDGTYLGFAGSPGTAVRPSLRGLGIATALKVRVIVAARQQGITTLRSASGNPAMLKVNERLGYRRTTTEVRLVRPLVGAVSPGRG